MDPRCPLCRDPGGELLWEDAVYSRLMKAKNADVFMYTHGKDIMQDAKKHVQALINEHC